MRFTPSPHRATQLSLLHPRRTTLQWAKLPPEIRQQTLDLLVQLLRQHRLPPREAVTAKELRDE